MTKKDFTQNQDLIQFQVNPLNSIRESLFSVHEFSDVHEDLDKMYFEYINSNHRDKAIDIQSATVTYRHLKTLLSSLQRNCHPDQVKKVELFLT
jgi:hypothetical protein